LQKSKKAKKKYPALTAVFTSAFLMEEIKDVQISERVFVGFFLLFYTGNMSKELCQTEMSVGEFSE